MINFSISLDIDVRPDCYHGCLSYWKVVFGNFVLIGKLP